MNSASVNNSVVACISSFPEDAKKRFAKMLLDLGAHYVENLTAQVNLLICGSAGTQKYNVKKLHSIYRLLMTARFQ